MVIKQRCSKCDSTQTYYRTKTADYHCQSCGNNFKESDYEVEDKE